MTFDASRLTVLQMTAPQPSSKALPMTFAFVPGGPEPMTKGLGSFRPLTVHSSVGMTASSTLFRTAAGEQQYTIHHKGNCERHEPCISINPIHPFRGGWNQLYGMQESRGTW